MAIINGTNLLVFVDGTAVASSQDCQITLNNDLPDATTKDSEGWSEHIVGLKDWSGSCSGLYDPANANTTIEDIMETIINGTEVEIRFGVAANGSVFYRGNAHFSSAGITAPMEAASSYDISFTGNGPLEAGIYPPTT